MDSHTFFKSISHLLQTCTTMQTLKQIHTRLITSPHLSEPDRLHLISRLIFALTHPAFGSLAYATRVSKTLKFPNLYIYNSLIRANSSQLSKFKFNRHCERCERQEAVLLYKQMLVDTISPDNITIPFVVKECVSSGGFLLGQCVHAHSVKFGLIGNVYVSNSLIGFWGGFGDLGRARQVFDEMPQRDVVSWNLVVGACLRFGEVDVARALFRNMGCDCKNVISWNSMISGMVQGGRSKEAVEVFREMVLVNESELKVYPDKVTLASVVSACASLGWLNYGKGVHGYVIRNGIESDTVLRTTVLDMYGKCGNVSMAKRVFDDINKKDVLAWTSMVSVYALHGYGNEAFDLFDRMVACGVRPNLVTYGALLTACSHLGLVDKGRLYFSMIEEPTVQHYACMVDILGRAGLFDEAERLITKMPMDPDVYVWGALLGACQMHGNVELGEKVAKRLIRLEPENHAFYVALCDIYAKGGKFDDLEKTRIIMNERRIKKDVPGNSMIEVDGVVYEFSIKGSCDNIMEEIKGLLYQLSKEIKVDQDTLIILKEQ
ncbi:pentatricopeptide repeat-containing protein At5g56310-like [Bidens hawaiensis]|uniref:pentatricopeptide repeat-containing protein At5g56310-like n=1 Tax=Bidens hawaiensis TaxID=980011 RepID=UPI004049F930